MATINLKIPEELKEKLEKKIKETEFSSLNEYINYVLKQIIFQENDSIQEEAYSEDEEEAMKARLKELGYV